MTQRTIFTIALTLALGCLAAVAMGATTNFVMRGNFPPEFIAKAEQQAEHCRKTLAVEWLGYELPAWRKPCTVELVPHGGSGGATFFGFDANGKGFDFEGKWQGPEQGLLQDVIPHEVLHTVLASHFGRVPRWADEGAAMNVETPAGTGNFEQTLHAVLYEPGRGGIPTEQLIHFAEYPKAVAVFYGQSHSLVKFLLQFNGKPGFVAFLEQALRVNDYEPALKEHFNLSEATLQAAWLSWYQAGQPLAPNQIGVRSVSYQGEARWIWDGRRWIQCRTGSCPTPQVRPVQPSGPSPPVNPAPLAELPPKPAAPACKSCDCNEAALIARITKLEAAYTELLARQGTPGPPGKQGERGPQGLPGQAGKDAQPPAIETIVAEVVKQIPPAKSCECKQQGAEQSRPSAPIAFDIEPLE